MLNPIFKKMRGIEAAFQAASIQNLALASTIIISLPIVIAEPTQAASFTVYRDRSNIEIALGGIPTITEDFQSFTPTYN